MSALSEHYAGKECSGDFTDEDIANLAAFIWAAGADHETADFVAKQLLKKGLRLVPYTPSEAMWQAGKAAGVTINDTMEQAYAKVCYICGSPLQADGPRLFRK
jgi:hypothetical protein